MSLLLVSRVAHVRCRKLNLDASIDFLFPLAPTFVASRRFKSEIKDKEKKEPEKESAKPSDTSSRRDPLDTSFDNPEAAFKSKTTWELVRGYIVYTLCSSNYLVDNNLKLMKTFQKIFGKPLFSFMMKCTFYGHFVAGEDQKAITPVMSRLYSFGVRPILDYSAEEDISQEEAEKMEMEAAASVIPPAKEAVAVGGEMPQFKVQKEFADRRSKVDSARTYFYKNEATCERNTEIFKECIQAVAGTAEGTGIAAMKLTALGRPQLLLRLSEVIMRARAFVTEVHGGHGNVIGHNMTAEELEQKLSQAGVKDTNKFLKKVVTDKKGVIHLFPWSGIINENYDINETFRLPCIKEKKMVRLLSQLSPTEEQMFRNTIRRLNSLAVLAQELNVRLMIDAEQTYFQPAISRITLEMMNKYNKNRAVVYNTYQCYLKEAFNEVSMDLEQARRQEFYFAAKMVRGAYMDQERARAKSMGYEDPINPTYEATSEMYHNTMAECLRKIKEFKDNGEPPNKIEIMIATHNEDSVRIAIEKMKEIGISPEDKVICFGQLLGMCDYITFPLGQSGYSAYKYVPYGPVIEVLPYLSRRAVENRGVLVKVKKEKRLLLAEIIRRVKNGQLFYKPKGDYKPI